MCSRVVHFSLAQNTTIDSVEVRWVVGKLANASPNEKITGVAADGSYRIVEATGAATKIK